MLFSLSLYEVFLRRFLNPLEEIMNDVVTTNLLTLFSPMVFSHTSHRETGDTKSHSQKGITMNLRISALSLLTLQWWTSEVVAFVGTRCITGSSQPSSCLNARNEVEIKKFMNRDTFLKRAVISGAAFFGSSLTTGSVLAIEDTASTRPESLDIENFLRTGA